MHHVLQISRKIDYALRAMIYLASQPPERTVPFRQVAERMRIPKDFLAKILKILVEGGLLRSTRGPHGGYALTRLPSKISFLDVIEAVEGPVSLNVCLSEDGGDPCSLLSDCTMMRIWRLGQEKLIDVYRSATLDQLVMPAEAPVRILSHSPAVGGS